MTIIKNKRNKNNVQMHYGHLILHCANDNLGGGEMKIKSHCINIIISFYLTFDFVVKCDPDTLP